MKERVKFYGSRDFANGFMLGKALAILKELHKITIPGSINDVLELYNIQKYIEAKIFRTDFSDEDKAFFSESNAKLINKILGNFFSRIDDETIISYIDNIERDYEEDFLELMNKYKICKNISGEAFLQFINGNKIPIVLVLAHEKLVNAYDNEIRDLLLSDNQSIEILINKYLKKTLKRPIILPKSLSNDDKEQIAKNYISCDLVHPGTLETIATLPNLGEFKITDEVRLSAKERYDKEIQKIFDRSNGSGIKTEIVAGISEEQSEPFINSFENGKMSISVSAKWIKENLDFPTLLNNFIYIYNFVDTENRIEFISKPNQIGTLERLFTDTELRNVYLKGYFFEIFNKFAIIEMVSYCEYLKNAFNIRVEDILQWFFDAYLEEEFKINNFIVSMPSAGSTYLEKCRTICSELESILKQYNVFVKTGAINHDLIEISSKPIDFLSIKSLIPDKYIYLNEKNSTCLGTTRWLFSDQTMLTYLPKRELKKEYDCLFELLINEDVNISEYEEYQRNDIEMLINEKIVAKDDNGNLALYNPIEAAILWDLYKNGFSSNQFLKKHKMDEALAGLVEKDWVYTQSTLLSEQECDYFDFYLNKSKFSNGQDIRNTYLHGTQRKRGTDDDLHRVNYYRLLMFVVLIVIKINDELCYRDEEKDEGSVK